MAATRPGALAPYEAKLVSHFLPQAAVALQIAQRTESLQQKVLAAHRKHAMADLARGVAHDVNNAVGTILPLVQQIREDLWQGSLDPQVLDLDLEVVVEKALLCKRIFANMLRVARTGRAGDGPVPCADRGGPPPSGGAAGGVVRLRKAAHFGLRPPPASSSPTRPGGSPRARLR